jgi:hypothetical protein
MRKGARRRRLIVSVEPSFATAWLGLGIRRLEDLEAVTLLHWDLQAIRRKSLRKLRGSLIG